MRGQVIGSCSYHAANSYHTRTEKREVILWGTNVDLRGPGTIGPVPKKDQTGSVDTQVFTSDTGKIQLKQLLEDYHQ